MVDACTFWEEADFRIVCAYYVGVTSEDGTKHLGGDGLVCFLVSGEVRVKGEDFGLLCGRERVESAVDKDFDAIQWVCSAIAEFGRLDLDDRWFRQNDVAWFQGVGCEDADAFSRARTRFPWLRRSGTGVI